MKRIFLSLITAVVSSLGIFAQTDLVATLSHGSTISTFSGTDALSEAYEAAEDGDIITLSPGVFQAVDIEKAITLRGAGMIPSEYNGYISTQIGGDLNVKVPSEATSITTIEGIHFLNVMNVEGNNLTPISFSKSKFEKEVSAWGVDMNVYSCLFASILVASNNRAAVLRNTTINCFNSVIVDAFSSGYILSNSTPYVAKIVASNCILGCSPNSSSAKPYCNFINCIICGTGQLSSLCEAHMCIGINLATPSKNIFENIIDTSNSMVVNDKGLGDYSLVFKTLTRLNVAIDSNYELTEAAAATYLGEDGTQVGIYGGATPYDPTPTNPLMKKFILNSTTEGNQLKVKINVE